MNDAEEKCSNAVPDVPVWQRALEARAKNIEAEMNRLHGERESILNVLSRIGSPAPQAVTSAASYPVGASLSPRW